MYIFITVSIGFTKKSRLGPARRPDHFDPTRRHLWYWNVSDVHIMVIKYILYDGPMWWGGVGAGPAFSVSFVRPPWRLENRSKTFVIDPKVCSRSTISKSFSVTFHSFMSLPHHTLPNHQRKRDTCETLYTNLNLVKGVANIWSLHDTKAGGLGFFVETHEKLWFWDAP